MDERKTEETTSGGEESEVEVDEGAKTGIRCGKTDERGQESETELRQQREQRPTRSSGLRRVKCPI